MTETISDKSDVDIGEGTRRRWRRRAIAIAVATVVAVLLMLNSVSVFRHTSEATGDQIVHLDDGDLHVTENGPPDAPAVLLIHGFAGSSAWWNPVVPMLQQRYRVIRVDLLGHGASAKPVGGYDIPAQGRRVGAVLDRLRVNQAVIVGHSTGGAVATALAEQRPDVVAALALYRHRPHPGRLHLARFPRRSDQRSVACSGCGPNDLAVTIRGRYPKRTEHRLHPEGRRSRRDRR